MLGKQILTLIFFSVFFAAAMTLGSTVASCQIVDGSPAIALPASDEDRMCSPREHDFGEVKIGQLVEHQFEIKNPFEKTLVVESVSSSCGCLTPKIDSQQIAVGGTAKLTVSVDTNKFRGRKQGSIHVVFKESTVKELVFAASVLIRNINLEPEKLAFRGIEAGKTYEQTLIVKRTGSPYWRVREITTSDNKITAKVSKKQIQKNTVTYAISIKLDNKQGPCPPNQYLTLKTNDSNSPKVDVPISIAFSEALSASPKTIRFTQAESPQKQQLIVRSKTETTLSFEVNSPRVKVATRNEKPSKLHLVSIELVNGENGTDLPSNDTLKIQSGTGDSIEIPITFPKSEPEPQTKK